MTIAINIRGTGGSGKSTLVKKIVELYPDRAPFMKEGRKRTWFTLHLPEDKRLKGLVVPGHYDTACGGCDTLKTVDEVYDIVRKNVLGDENPTNALYEGIMVMDDVTRAVKLHQDLEKQGGRLVVVSLTTSIEDCLAGIRARKEARGDTKPLNEKNTRDRMKRQESSLHRLKQAGVPLEKLSRDDAFNRIRELLGL